MRKRKRNRKKKISKLDVINDIKQVTENIGRSPSRCEYEKLGKISPMSARRLFGSWNKALHESTGSVVRNTKKASSQFSCCYCQKEITKLASEINKSKTNRFFCSRSCSATYNNKNKSYGTRRSKLEKWLEKQLISIYPNLEFHFNRKDAINSELDIYIPSLKLAFELNGIFHYEPIYGKEKLSSIKNNDNRKFQACLENNIELCTIDTSSLNYFKPKNAEKYLNIIKSIINLKMR